VMVPASEDVIIKSGVLFYVGVGRVLPEIPGAVVSVVVLSVVEVSSSLVVDVLSVVVVVVAASSLLLQEMIVRLKRDMRIMYKTLFIYFTSNERK
jgi:hypothetical protein